MGAFTSDLRVAARTKRPRVAPRRPASASAAEEQSGSVLESSSVFLLFGLRSEVAVLLFDSAADLWSSITIVHKAPTH